MSRTPEPPAMSAHDVQNATDAVDSRHLLVVGAGPGLGASVARRFAREGYRVTLVARSQATTAALADELRAAGTDVTVVAADAGDPDRLRAAGGGTLLFTGRGFADALPEPLATLSLGKLALRGAATMLARTVRNDGIHAGSLTILGQIAAGTPFDPDRIADAYWAIRNEDPDAWREEYRFDGALATTAGVFGAEPQVLRSSARERLSQSPTSATPPGRKRKLSPTPAGCFERPYAARRPRGSGRLSRSGPEAFGGRSANGVSFSP